MAKRRRGQNDEFSFVSPVVKYVLFFFNLLFWVRKKSISVTLYNCINSDSLLFDKLLSDNYLIVSRVGLGYRLRVAYLLSIFRERMSVLNG